MRRTTSGSETNRRGTCVSEKRRTTSRSGEALRLRLPRDVMRICARFSMGNSTCMRLLALAGCLALVAGCSITSTTVDKVWQDSARADAALGKTLVVSLFPNPEFAIPIENEWTRQLQGRGIDAYALNALLPGERHPDEQRVVELVKAKGFNTLLVSRLVDVKKVERDIPASQVAVVETQLYDTGTEQPFWSARSDTFMVSPTGDHRDTDPRAEQIRGFVETIIHEMSKSKVL